MTRLAIKDRLSLTLPPDNAIELQPAARLPYVLMVAVISILVISLTVAALMMEKQRQQERAKVATQNIVNLLDQHLSDVFDKVDVILHAISHHYQGQSSNASLSTLNDYLEHQQAQLPELLNLRITDQNGVVRFGQGVAATDPVSLADRDFFISARDDSADVVIISGPVFARMAQQWVMVFARRLNNADGSFAGVAYANIATTHFDKMFSTVMLGAHGAATIRTTDLAMVHRYPDTKGAVGSKEVSQQLRDRILAQPEGGEYTASTKIDGIERVNAYRRLTRYPFYVIVGLATEDFLDEWHTNGLILVGLASLTLLMAGLAAQRLYRTAQHNAADQANRRRVREQDAILNSDILGIVVIKDRTCTWCNQRFAEMLGYDKIELIGRPSRLVYQNDDDYAAFTRNVILKINAGQLCKLEHQYKHKNGSLVWLEVCGQQMYLDETETIWAIADITERKQAAEELALHRHHLEDLVTARTQDFESAESRLRLVIESTADGIIELDPVGNVRMVNPAASSMLGLTPEELIGRNVHDAIHYRHVDGSPYPASECAVVTAIISGRKLRLDSDLFWHADGQAIPVAVATHPIWHNNKVAGAVMSFFDNSARNQAEQVREEARQAAEQLARLKSDFLANMSHEIRTPLNGVLGLAQIGYRDSVGRSKTQETFVRILDSGKLLLTIINDILDFSKIESDKLAIESIPIDPGYVVDEAVSTLGEAAAAKGIDLIGAKAPDLPAACLGDPYRISQILLNLLSNAIKFTTQGEVRLSAYREGDQLVFLVTDSGIGIPPESIDRLFMPFEQADSTTTRNYGGTGLGLAISRRLAEMMGGSLSAASEVGQGSNFTLRLPLRETDQPAHQCIRSTPSSSNRLAGMRILAAEDNSVNQLVLEDFLVHEGAAIEMVVNGQLAVEAVAQGTPFDVVLMDVQMPVMDGIEATRKLRQIAPNLPVIGQTAHALKEEHDRCLAAGMVATITKPLDIEIVVAILLDHVNIPDRQLSESSLVIEEPTSATNQVLDWVTLAERYSGRPAFIDRLVDIAIKGHANDAVKLRDFINTGDLPEIGKIAHSLKGLAGNIIARDLEKIAIRVMHAEMASSENVFLLAKELADAVERLIDELRQGKPA